MTIESAVLDTLYEKLSDFLVAETFSTASDDATLAFEYFLAIVQCFSEGNTHTVREFISREIDRVDQETLKKNLSEDELNRYIERINSLEEHLSELDQIDVNYSLFDSVSFTSRFQKNFMKWYVKNQKKKHLFPRPFINLKNLLFKLLSIWNRYKAPVGVTDLLDSSAAYRAKKTFGKAVKKYLSSFSDIDAKDIYHMHYDGDGAIVYAIYEKDLSTNDQKSSSRKNLGNNQKSSDRKNSNEEEDTVRKTARFLSFLDIGGHRDLYGESSRLLNFMRRHCISESSYLVRKIYTSFPAEATSISGWFDLHSPLEPFGTRWGRGVIFDRVLEDNLFLVLLGGPASTHAQLKSRSRDSVIKTFYWGYSNNALYLHDAFVGKNVEWSSRILASVAVALSESVLRGVKFAIRA